MMDNRVAIWYTLTAEGKDALERSVQKWIRIVLGKGRDNGAKNCPLCLLYKSPDCSTMIPRELWDVVELCPVRAQTGKVTCDGSPYITWENHHTRTHHAKAKDALKVKCNTCRKYAQKTLRFLTGFLPAGHKLHLRVTVACARGGSK